jgi:hypothetical protein
VATEARRLIQQAVNLLIYSIERLRLGTTVVYMAEHLSPPYFLVLGRVEEPPSQLEPTST